MTMNELKSEIEKASWFTNLGEFPGAPHMIPIRRIHAVENFQVVVDFDHPGGKDLSVEWKWLPTQRDQADPIYGNELKELGQKRGQEELRKVTFEIYKLTLESLRKMCQNPLFKVGPHDSTEVARGAALYATRMAATEIFVEKKGFWCSLIPLYVGGFWPRGFTANGDLLVF